MNRKKWKTRGSYAVLTTLLAMAGVVFAAHFAFTVPHSWDAIEDVNEAHVQNRAGQLNVAKAIGDTVTATFSDNQCGTFIREFLISTNAFLQTGGPFACGGGGGGGCAIVDPMTSILAVDGQRSQLAQAGGKALTRLGSAEAGGSIVLDEHAVVHLGRQGAALGSASDGFQRSPGLIDALVANGELNRLEAVPGTRAEDLHAYSGAAAQFKASGDTAALLIQHQREHPANHNFAPIPRVTFEPQPYADPVAQGQRGFAVVDLGESGHVRKVEILTADGMTPPGSLAAVISAGLRTQFKDHRRHDHRAYLAYRIDAGVVQIAGEPIVTLPMCCPGPPGPGEQCGQVHCEEN